MKKAKISTPESEAVKIVCQNLREKNHHSFIPMLGRRLGLRFQYCTNCNDSTPGSSCGECLSCGKMYSTLELPERMIITPIQWSNPSMSTPVMQEEE